MPTISIKSDAAKAFKEYSRLTKKAAKGATVAALNKTGKRVTTIFAKETSRVQGYTQRKIKQRMVFRRATRQNMTYLIDARKAKSPNLIAFVDSNKRNPDYFRKRKSKSTAFGKAHTYKYPGVQHKAYRRRQTAKKTFIINAPTKQGKRAIVVSRLSDNRNAKLRAKWGPSIRGRLIKEFKNLENRGRALFRIEMQRALNVAMIRAGLA